jgi:hypothetical protein
MAPDGQLSVTFAALEGARRYNFDFQALPWLDASFRYSSISNFRGFDPYYDRSFGLKIRLLQESRYLPDVSVGIRDLLGTGVYSAEYMVGSKRIGDFDLTFGVGWGRLSQSDATDNPLADIFKSFKTRADINSPGTVNANQLFHGPKIGFFGGAAWHTPIKNLDVIVEYSPDRYQAEAEEGNITYRMPVNMGLSYRPYDFVTVSAGWLYGSSYGVTITFTADPTIPQSLYRVGPAAPHPTIRADQDQSRSLSLLLENKRPLQPGAPFVSIGRANDPIVAVRSALTSETIGVRDMELVGRTLMVDAVLTDQSQAQCGVYARVVSGLGTTIDTVAVSDIEHGEASVSLCKVQRINARGTVDPGRPLPTTLAQSEAAIRAGISGQGLDVEALTIHGAEVWVYFRNYRYNSEAEAVGRIGRVLMAAAPPSVEVFHIVSVRNGLAMRDATLSRSALERAATVSGTSMELGDAITLRAPPLSNPVLDAGQSGSYPRFHWGIGPNIREGLFNPHQAFQIELFGQLFGEIEAAPGVALDFRAEANIYNNFVLNVPSNSQLPHVRSDILEYYRHGINGISEFDGKYRTRLSRDTFLEVKAGILESMFTGAGAQVLWRQEDSRFAFGADVYQVWQRNFDRLFGVQKYNIVTGHVTAYYASPWYDLNFAVHAGRYLAGDYGATIQITRKFSTGVEIGAFATFTNVPFAKFGEGSFDKGIYVHIPFEWGLPFYSQSAYDLILHSLTRDGGQRLDNDDSLYDETEPTSFDEMARHIDEITTP